MLIMERSGLDSLLKSKFTLGGDASVAAGPVGRESAAETDAAMKAKILSYSRSRGVFAGVSLKGTTMNQDEDANSAVYGKPLNSDEILAGGVAMPAGAKPLTDVLTKYSPKGISGTRPSKIAHLVPGLWLGSQSWPEELVRRPQNSQLQPLPRSSPESTRARRSVSRSVAVAGHREPE